VTVVAAELLEVGVLFAVVATVGILATHLGQSVIPFYIVAGILSGPFVAGRLTEAHLGQTLAVGTSQAAQHFVEIGAELGIVFLLFFLGLEFSVDRLLRDRRKISTVGAIDFVVNFGIGVAIGLAFGWTTVETLFLAGLVYISSSAIVTKSLIETGWIAND
jgi:CPA2 family monovalent cation:H+ antiporter-2